MTSLNEKIVKEHCDFQWHIDVFTLVDTIDENNIFSQCFLTEFSSNLKINDVKISNYIVSLTSKFRTKILGHSEQNDKIEFMYSEGLSQKL